MKSIEDLIPQGRRNRPGLKLRGPEYITIHSTANTRAGANAEMHGRYLRGGAAEVPVSWHYTVDEAEIRRHLPLDEVGWHAGDGRNGPGNRSSIGIEICENKDGNLDSAVKNAADLTARLISRFHLGLEHVKQHYHWSQKNCPRIFRDQIWGSWEDFLQVVKSAAPSLTPLLGEPRASEAQAKEYFRIRTDLLTGSNISRSVKLSAEQVKKLIALYWKYGRKTGIRPEAAFAQAMKETGFLTFERSDGRPGAVSPEHYNYAGIKTRTAAGDRPEDHERFADMDEGIRAHFNHLAAYTGLEPIGTPHGRFELVAGLVWAGTVQHVEELGGKWAPDAGYGRSIVEDYLEKLLAVQVEENEADGSDGNGRGKGPFPDIPACHWAAGSIAWALEKGLVKGLPDGRFAKDEAHRQQKAELVAMFRRFYEILQEGQE